MQNRPPVSPGRALERSGTMTRSEKRALDASAVSSDGASESKRPRVPALASVIVEALKVDSLQKLCSSLEPILRRVVSEEVERALARLGPAKLQGRSSPQRLEGPNGRNLQLHFRTRLSLPIFTGGKVEGEQGAAIHVVLVDANTGMVVTLRQESSLKLDVLVLEGDFNKEDEEGWTPEEFESHVVKEREGKRPLLTGELQVTLKEGVGTLGELIFTDNSSWIRSRKFRLGLKVASGCCDGVRIREAKTEAFTVKDHRGELYKKHYPPALSDDVWRLEKIGKDGAFHKKLNSSHIYTVEDFLRLLVRDQQKLRNILGSGMSNRMWESLVDHAKTCVLSGKHYVYYAEDGAQGAIFNNIYEFVGLIFDAQFYSAESLTESQRVFADVLVKKAYDNWTQVIEYDGKALLRFKQKKSTSARSEPATSTNYSPYDSAASQKQLPSISDDGQMVRYSSNGENVGSYPPLQFDGGSYISVNQFDSSTSAQQTGFLGNDGGALELEQPPQMNLEFQPLSHSMGINSYNDWSSQHDNQDYLLEEIRMRSHEILENDEMQQLLRLLNNGGGPTTGGDDGYGFPSFMPPSSMNSSFEEDRSRSSGKAVVGWLKIKAAMRWGIFVRKKAAERRAQLVELEGEEN